MAGVKIQHEAVRDAIRWARRYIPIRVAYRSVDQLGGDAGRTSQPKRTGPFVVSLLRSLSEVEALDTLLHELAHVMDVHRNGWKETHFDQHGDSWGREHARIYQDYWEYRTKRDKACKIENKKRSKRLGR